MRFSIVVTFHHGASFLRACLDSLLETTPDDVEIIVVANNSDKREIDIDFDYPRVRFESYYEDLGHAGAANAGVALARGDYIIFADHDLIFKQGWFEASCTVHFQSPEVGATSVRVVNPHTMRILDFGIGFSRFNAPHPHLDQPLDSALVQRSRRVQAMCCGGLMIEKRLFEDLGGFDRDLGNFYTDIDLCLRLKDVGKENWVAAEAIAFHFGGDFSLVDRAYKASHLKSDVKAWFRAKNDARIVVDMEKYYDQSWRHFVECGPRPSGRYIGCCIANVADPAWYVEIARGYFDVGDVTVRPSGHRDSGAEGLYEVLGYDHLKLRSPIVYIVDRFVSLAQNRLWWQQRSAYRDIVMDRHGNILWAADVAR